MDGHDVPDHGEKGSVAAAADCLDVMDLRILKLHGRESSATRTGTSHSHRLPGTGKGKSSPLRCINGPAAGHPCPLPADYRIFPWNDRIMETVPFL